MVAGAFPAAKLGILLIRQISKPLANRMKERAKHSYFFRTYICMPPAQLYHWCEVKAKMWVMNLGKPTIVPKLNESMAIELGAELLGEGILLGVAAGALIWEYNRQVNKSEKEKEHLENRFLQLEKALYEMEFMNEEQATKLRELTRILYTVDSKLSSQGTVTEAVPINVSESQKSTEKKDSSSTASVAGGSKPAATAVSVDRGVLAQALSDAEELIQKREERKAMRNQQSSQMALNIDNDSKNGSTS